MQEHGKKMLYRNAGAWNAKEKSRSKGMGERKGPQEHAFISVDLAGYYLQLMLDVSTKEVAFSLSMKQNHS